MNENLTLTDFISDFDNLYDSHKEIIFNLFQNGSFSFEEKKEIFKKDMKSDLHVFFRQHAVTEIMDYFLKE